MGTALQVVTAEASREEEALLKRVAPLQRRLAEHPLYASIRSITGLRLFMESHVYAVWDFMSLLKALQRALTCVEVPWHPTVDARSRRLINEIVLGEESDVYEEETLSHYELYLRAMESCEAGVARVRTMVEEISAGASIEKALAGVPEEAAEFVRSTFAVIATGSPHKVAAAFTLGREDLIPEMFSAFVRELNQQLSGRIAAFRYYLERHIELDGEEHGQMAMQMLRQLCVTGRQWDEAAEAAEAALEARLRLWDGIHARILRLEAAAGCG